MRSIIFMTLQVLLFPIAMSAYAQTDTVIIEYSDYISYTLKNSQHLKNKEYAIEKADANITRAGISPDPVLSFGNVSYDMSGQSLPSQWYAGVSQKVELGGKRKARVSEAMAEREMVKADYSNSQRELILAETEKFINALVAQLVFEKELTTYESIKKELTFKRSTTTDELEHTKIAIEMGNWKDHVLQTELEMKLLQLEVMKIYRSGVDQSRLKANLDQPYRHYNVDSLIANCINRRPDLRAIELQDNLIEREKDLIRANRKVDIDLGLGDNYYTRAYNDIAPAPAYHAILATASIPLKISNRHTEASRIASLAGKQNETQKKLKVQDIETEIKKAFEKYELSHQELKLYKEELLIKTDKMLQMQLKNYISGNDNFLELSEAHRKVDEVYLSYFHSLKEAATALVELEYATGSWDIELK